MCVAKYYTRFCEVREMHRNRQRQTDRQTDKQTERAQWWERERARERG